MNLGIRARLFISFILIAIVPLIITLGGIALAFKLYFEEPDMTTIDNLVVANEVVKDKIIENFNSIDNYEEFHQELKPLLDLYDIELQIVDPAGNILYNSTTLNTHQINNLSYQLFTFNTPIVINNQIVANAIIAGDETQHPFHNFTQLIKLIVLSLILGITSFIIITIVATLYISRGVLKPLQQLNMATEHISKGNLDYEINYQNTDELGRFCSSFDLMRRRLKASLEKQEEYEKSRKEMLASISHDLRTPIATIKGYVEGLLDNVAKNEKMVEKYLGVIKNKTDQLDRLIDDLTQFSKLDLDKIEINPVWHDSQDVFRGLIKGYELEFSSSEIDFKVNEPLPKVSIWVDKIRIEQVLDNLVGNAKRYLQAGGFIKIEFKETEDRLIVAINDNGSGISEEDLPYIFDRFYRGEKSRSRDYGGTGLGLAICQYIINAHGGKIWVESQLGIGSTFYFSLPKKNISK